VLDRDAREGSQPRSSAHLATSRRATLIDDIANHLLVPALAARFGAPVVGTWRRDAAALAATLADGTLDEGVAALAALNPDGLMFRPICRDIILPAAVALRRRYDLDAFDQSERLSKVWQLRMCLLSLDDADALPTDLQPGTAQTALTLSGKHDDLPSVEHGVALRFFDRAGWQVWDCHSHAAEEARDSAHDHRFDVAWISIEPGQAEDDIRETVQGLRRASCNAGILVLGGGLVGQLPADPGALSLDGYTGSATEAAEISASVLRLRRAGLRR
jgi:methylmalonyl-CoA mutase cobalamin-binding subunit